ncbi:DUF7003 family protein [Pradoshia eiseniae]|uniref:DUF7003 family protein n=1 Tax=Pradoshia eiseniae TaxID=2064768 RepID=UPI0011B01753|nr:hypothetical protein [Pradoshia eiseniae]
MNEAQLILSTLDKRYKEYKFPILENENFDFVSGKFSIFVDNEKNWCVVFQIFCLSKIGPQIAVYYIGNEIITEDNLYLTDAFEFVSNEGEHRDFEEIEQGFIFNSNIISIDGNLFIIPGWNNEENVHKVSIKNEWVTFLRLIVKNKKCLSKLWLSDEEQLKIADLSTKYKLFYTTENWRHPHFMEELPSQLKFFKLITASIINNDPSIIKEDNPNTNWEHWSKYDSVVYY